MGKEAKFVQFQLLDSVQQKDIDGNIITVQNSRHQLSAKYSTRDATGREVKEVISTGVVWNEKQKKEVPVEVDSIIFLDGFLMCMEGRDQHIIDGLRRSVNNESFAGRYPSDKAIFKEIDPEANLKAEVEEQDALFEAQYALKQASAADVIEYAKALNLGVGDLTADKKFGKKAVEDTPEFKDLMMRMKSEAKKNPKAFTHNFTNPLRGMLALVSDGIYHNQISYDAASHNWAWVQGQNKTPIIQVPNGVKDEREWFAAWLKENNPTSGELATRLEAARKMK